MKQISYFAAAIAAASVIGCAGGGGGSDNTTTGSTSQQLSKATTDLNTAFASKTYSATTFQKAQTEFAGLAGCGPVDPRIDAGYAIVTLLIHSLADYETISGTLSVTPGSSIPTTGLTGAMLAVDLPFHNPSTIPNPIQNLVSTIASSPGAPASITGQFQLSQLPTDQSALADLNNTIHSLLNCELTTDHITALESNPIVLTIPNPNNPAKLVTVKIGSAEMYSLRAALYFLSTVLDALTSYNVDAGTFSLDSLVSPAVAPHKNNGPFSVVGILIPGGQFLVRTTDNGAEQQAFIQDGANDMVSAVNVVQGRTDNLYLLNELGLTTVQLATIKDYANQITAFATSTQTLKVKIHQKPETLQLSLPNFFQHRPTDMKTLFPTVTFDGTYVNLYQFPDPTLGGLILNGKAVFDDAYGNPISNTKFSDKAVTPTITFRQWY